MADATVAESNSPTVVDERKKAFIQKRRAHAWALSRLVLSSFVSSASPLLPPAVVSTRDGGRHGRAVRAAARSWKQFDTTAKQV